MNIQSLKETIGGIDIYLLDQILKERYQTGEKILDAGCGNGRNLKWFYNAGFEVYGVDLQLNSVRICKERYQLQKNNFIQSEVKNMPFNENSFNHVICNAVLHFASNESEFYAMFEKLVSVLKLEGSLFIRMASSFGIENEVKLLENGVYSLPDGSTRFLLTQEILNNLLHKYNITLIETVKTTIVHNLRCMTTLVFKRN